MLFSLQPAGAQELQTGSHLRCFRAQLAHKGLAPLSRQPCHVHEAVAKDRDEPPASQTTQDAVMKDELQILKNMSKTDRAIFFKTFSA